MDTSLKEFVGKVRLRNWHYVYRDTECFVVKQTKPDGTKRPEETCIPSDAIDHLYELCRGKKISPQTAKNYVSDFAQEYDLPYTYGHKLGFYAQEMLVVLVATGRAHEIQKGKEFEYQVT